jgi:phage shock protein A
MRILARMLAAGRNVVRTMLEPAPDPRQSGSSLKQQQELLVHVRAATEEVARIRRALEGSLQRLSTGAEGMREQAGIAVLAGREEIARQVLHRRELVLAEIEVLQRRIDEVREQEANLALAEEQIRARLETFRATEEIERARLKADEKLGAVLDKVTREAGSIDYALERARSAMTGLSSNAAAVDQLAGLLEATGDPLSELRRGGAADNVERELAELKRAHGAESVSANNKSIVEEK